MKVLLLFLISFPLFALDNACRLTDTTGSPQTARPVHCFWQFKKGEIPNYPRPYVDGSSVTPWQSDEESRYDDGSMKNAHISFKTNISANTQIVVDFRNSTDRCSSGNDAACNAAGLDEAGMLAFNGGTWDVTMSAVPSPNGGSLSPQTVSARTMLDAGFFSYIERGPVRTVVRVEDKSASRTYDFGYREKLFAMGNVTISSTATEATFQNIPDYWATISRPFLMNVQRIGGGGETMNVCWVDLSTNKVYFGDTDTGSSSCQNLNGRGEDGTTQQQITADWMASIEPLTKLVTGVTSSSQTTLTVDATGLSLPNTLRIHGEYYRICNSSPTTYTVGYGASGCASSSYGRSQWGSNDMLQNPSGQPQPGARAFVHNVTSGSSWWVNAEIAAEKALSPAFYLTFYTGWSGVKWSGVLENTYPDRRADQDIDLTIADSEGTKYSRTGLRIIFGTRLHFPVTDSGDAGDPGYWDGDTPGAVRRDFNLAYKKYIGIIPNDPSVTITQGLVNQELTGTTATQESLSPSPGYTLGDGGAFDTKDSQDCGINVYCNYMGPMWRNWPGPGGRLDLAPFMRPFITAAYCWDSNLTGCATMNEYILAIGSVSGRFPHHFREYDASRYYCRKGHYPANTSDTDCDPLGANYNTLAVGRPFSLDARPTYQMFNVNVESADSIPKPRGAITANRAALNSISYAHSVPLAPFAYMISGDPFYQDEVVWMGHIALLAGTIPNLNVADTIQNRKSQRGCGSSASPYCMGNITSDSGYRMVSWMTRDLGYAAWASRDGTPEGDFLHGRWKRLMAIFYGKMNIPGPGGDTMFGDCSDAPTRALTNANVIYTPWCFGRTMLGRNATNPIWNNMDWGWQMTAGQNGVLTGLANMAYGTMAAWHMSYMWTGNNIAEAMGLPYVADFRRETQKWLLHKLNGSGGISPRTVAGIEEPTSPCPPEGTPSDPNCQSYAWAYGQSYSFSSFTALAAALRTDWKNNNTYWENSATQLSNSQSNDKQGGYANLAFGASAALLGGPSGSAPVSDSAAPTFTATRAWRWFENNLFDRASDGSNPMWLYSPVEQVLIKGLRQVGTNVHFTRFDGSACEYVVNPTSSLSTGATSIPKGSKNVVVDVTSLSPGDVFRVDCGYRNGRNYSRQTLTIQ